MRKIKYLLGNLNLLNIVLLLALILLVNYTALPFLRMNASFSLPPVKKPEIEKLAADETTAERKSPSLSDYTVIGEQNLFHPERTIPVVKAEAETKPLPKPEFVLYGTLVTEGLQLAYMEDKKAPEKKDGRKKQTALRLGESMSGFILKEIGSDKVVMSRGDEAITVSLNEPKVRETPAAATPAPAQTAAAAPAQTAVSRSAARGGRGRENAGELAARRERLRAVRERARREPGRMLFGPRRSSRSSGN